MNFSHSREMVKHRIIAVPCDSDTIILATCTCRRDGILSDEDDKLQYYFSENSCSITWFTPPGRYVHNNHIIIMIVVEMRGR